MRTERSSSLPDLNLHRGNESTGTAPLTTQNQQQTQRALIEGAPRPMENRLPPGDRRRRASLPAVVTATTTPAAETTAAPAVESEEQRTAREQGIRDQLTRYFEPHYKGSEAGGDESNRADLNALIENRVAGLLEMGESDATIQKTFSKGDSFGTTSAVAKGAIGSAAFGTASRLLDTKPEIGNTIVSGLNVLPGVKNAPDSFKGGVAAGLFSGAMDHVSGEALNPAMEARGGIDWFAPDRDRLDPVMQNALDAATPSMLGKMLRKAGTIQSFTARNAVELAVVPGIAAAGFPGAAATVTSGIAALGSMAAGAATSAGDRYVAKRDHLIGPEYLLARDDWREQYTALKDATWKGEAANGAGRVADALTRIPAAIVAAPHTYTTATSVATNVGALGLGLGFVSLATTATGALARSQGASEGVAEFAEQAVHLGTSALVFGSWTTLAEGTESAVGAIRGGLNAVSDLARRGVSTSVLKSAEVVGDGSDIAAKKVVEGADYTGKKLVSAGNAVVRGGEQAIEKTSAFVTEVRPMVTGAMNNLGERMANLRRRQVPAAGDLENQQTEAHPLGTMPGAFPE